MKRLVLLYRKLTRQSYTVTKKRKEEVGKIKLGVSFVSGGRAEYLLVGEATYCTAQYKADRFLDLFRYGDLRTIDNIAFNPEVYVVSETEILAHVSHKISVTKTERVRY